MVGAAKADGQPGIAITDHGVLHGLIDFYQTCQRHEIKPILGIESYFAEHQSDRVNTRVKEREKSKSDVEGSDKRYYHLTVLAENNTGYQNLIHLSSDAFLEGFYYKPRTDYEKLEQFSEGLIITSGCLGGPVLQELLHGRFDKALATASRLQDIVGRENFYIELQDHGIPEQVKTNPQLVEIARTLNAPMVACNDIHYTHHHDAAAHDILLCSQTHSLVSDPNRFKFQSDQHYLKSAAEMRHLFRGMEYLGACDNTLEICDRANVSIDFNTLHLPVFDVPEGFESPSAYLSHLAHEGLRERYSALTDEIAQRLAYELGVLETLGLSSYFLIVWDICKFADSQNIRRGPARGSVAGSLVAYLLDISKVDPIRHGLIFERFLNPSRIAMPDIDLDWDSRYREHIINYTREKYGDDHVAQIITFSIIRARSAVRDSARALGYEPKVGDTIAKQMPPLLMGEATPLKYCFEHSERYDHGYKTSEGLRALYKNDPDAKKILDAALGLEGLIRQDGIHAAGIVITPNPVTDYVPVQRRYKDGKPGPITTQYEKNTIESLGLLKMDYLGLQNLDIISDTLEFIGFDPGVDANEFQNIPTFDLLRQGNTIGVFQLESKPMRQLLQRLGPTSIDDIAAVVALYRPGPMGSNMHNDYADRKNGRQAVTYFHSDAKDILSSTYGLMIYQEQTMQIAQQFAGYTLAEADGLRKIIGKKLIDKMAQEKDRFVQGCVDNGYGHDLGERIFHLIESFAAYGFNKSHAYGYGYISYQTAFLKANYPAQYMAALCSAQDDVERCAFYLNEARQMGIELQTPDINKSDVGFTVSDNSIRAGLLSIRNVGEASVNKILEARQNGDFTSLVDFCQRVDPNVKELQSLAKAGALSEFGTRFGIQISAKEILTSLRKQKKKVVEGQVSMFDAGEMWEFNIPTTEAPLKTMLADEADVLGLYLTAHPLDDYVDDVTEWTVADLDQIEEGQRVEMLVVINKIDLRKTRAGAMMANLTVQDQTGTIEVVMFPKTYAERAGEIAAGSIGTLTIRGGENSFGERSYIYQGFSEIASAYMNDVSTTEDVKLFLPKGFHQDEEYVSKLKGLLISHHGSMPVQLFVSRSTVVNLPNEYTVENTPELLQGIAGLFKEYASR